MFGYRSRREKTHEAPRSQHGDEAEHVEHAKAVSRAHGPHFGGLEKKAKDMKVLRGVPDKPLDSLDDDEPGEEVAVERVEEKESSGCKDPRGFRNDDARTLEVLEQIHRTYGVKAAVGKRQGQCIARHVGHLAGVVVARRDCKTRGRRVDARNLMSELGEGIRQKAGSTANVENANGTRPERLPNFLGYKWRSAHGLGSEQGDGIVIRAIPALVEGVVERVIDRARGIRGHRTFQ